jgi:hypothetical protein
MSLDPKRAVEILTKTVANDAIGLKGTVAQEWRDSMTLGALAITWAEAYLAHNLALMVGDDRSDEEDKARDAYLAAAHPEKKP